MGTELPPGDGLEQTPGKRRKKAFPDSPKVRETREMTSRMLKETGLVLPSCPMNADELAAHWELGPDDLFSLKLNVLRAVKGTRTAEVVAEVAGVDYSMATLARKFGPGLYFIRGGGRHQSKVVKIPVSDVLAYSYGWGQAPELPSAADLVAQRTLQEATERPTDPMNLAAALELAAKRAASEALREAGIVPGMQHQPPVTQNPMQGFSQFKEMMGFFREMREDVRRDVEQSLGIKQPEPQAEGSEWVPLVKEGLSIFGAILANRGQPATMAAPSYTRTMPPERPAVGMETTGAPMESKQEIANLPALTPQEQAVMGNAAAMLRPFAGQLSQLAMSQITDQQAAIELVGYVPPAYYEHMVSLDGVSQARGFAVLGHISPVFASERWRGILHELATELQRPDVD